MPPITLKEIAKRSEVSFQAVSAVLNNRTGSRVSSTTRERIIRIARESGYQPHFGYQLMRGKNPTTVALLVSVNYIRITEYTRDLMLSLMEGFNDAGYATYAHTFGPDPKANLAKVRELTNRGVSHFVFLGSPLGHMEILAEIEASGLRYISTSPNFPRHVTKLKNPGRIELLREFRRRFGDGFKLMCQEHEGRPEPGSYLADDLVAVFPEWTRAECCDRLLHLIPAIDYNRPTMEMELFETGAAEAAVMRERYPDARAFVFMNDYFALGAARALHERGVAIGRDLSLAGHDNILAVQTSILPISTVAFDLPLLRELLMEHVFTDGECRRALPSRAILKL